MPNLDSLDVRLERQIDRFQAVYPPERRPDHIWDLIVDLRERIERYRQAHPAAAKTDPGDSTQGQR